MTKNQAAAIVLDHIEDYDRTIVTPVLQDWIEGRDFRRQDRHRVAVLQKHLYEIRTGWSHDAAESEVVLMLEPVLTEFLDRVTVQDSLDI